MDKLSRASQKNKIENPNELVAVLDEGGYQYILTAWYGKFSAAEFFSSIKYQEADGINFYYGEQLGHYHFVKEEADRRPEEQIIISPIEGLKKL